MGCMTSDRQLSECEGFTKLIAEEKNHLQSLNCPDRTSIDNAFTRLLLSKVIENRRKSIFQFTTRKFLAVNVSVSNVAWRGPRLL